MSVRRIQAAGVSHTGRNQDAAAPGAASGASHRAGSSLHATTRTHGGAQDAPAITRGALEGGVELAGEAVDMFLAIIGAEAGYMGLRALATGGVYLCGGITPKARRRAPRPAGRRPRSLLQCDAAARRPQPRTEVH